MQARRINAVVAFWKLFLGRTVFRHLAVVEGLARIERKPDGTLSWQLPDSNDAAAVPEVQDLRLSNVKLLYRDPTHKTDLALNLSTQEHGAEPPTLTVKGEGRYEDQASKVEVTGGSVLTLRDKTHPYPINGTFVSGATSITIKGTVTDPQTISGLNVNLLIKGQDGADLYRVAGVALPPTPPYVIDTHLDRDERRWIFKDLKWTMGRTDLTGELVWDLSNKTPLLTGQLHGRTVALVDLGGFIGAAPGEAKTPTEERRQAADRERERRVEAPKPEQSVATELVIPDKVLDLQKLNSMNAKVHFEADQIVDEHVPLDRLKAEIELQDGVLKLKPLEFGADKGKITIQLTVDGRARPVKTTMEATMQGFPLQRLVGKAGGGNTSWGSIGGHAEFSGTGDSMHRVLASSNGNVGVAVAGGQISLFLVELMGVDLAEALGIMLTKDKPTPIRCIVGDFALESGKMSARTMVADTGDTLFRGNGSVNLGREVFDMRVHAKPKDISPATLRSKLVLSGTFAHPSFGPDAKAMALRGGAAAALGVLLTPLASLLVLVDIGGGKDANCTALLKEAEK